MTADKAAVGDKLWERFNAPKTDIQWYYEGIAAAISDLSGHKMYQELTALLGEVFR
jgi:hypothetical protein